MKRISSHKKPLRYIISMIIAFLLAGVLCSCGLTTQVNHSSPTLENDETDDGITQLYFDIVFSSGLFSAKYDVDLLINDEKIGTIPYGERFTKLIDLDPGEYSLIFCSSDNHEIASPVEKINLKKDTTFACTLKAEKEAVKTSNKKISSGLIGAHLAVPDLSYCLLNASEDTLGKIGFVNIDYKSNNGKSIMNHSNWLVLSQSVSAGTSIDKNDPIVLTCGKKENLITEWFSGTNMLTAGPVADQYEYTISFINGVTRDELKASDFSEDEKSLWRVSSLTDQTGKSARLTVLYTGQVTVPNVTGQVLRDAVDSLRALNFSSVKEQTDSGSVWDRDNWFVIEQSIAAGQSIAADDTIILYCSKNADQKRSAFNIPVPLEQIILKDDSSSVAIGDTFNVSYDILPADATDVDLKYEYDSDYLSLNGGVFTALKNGNTVIRIKQSDSICADYAVEIRYVDVEAITLDETINLDVGNSYVPKVVIAPENASNKTYIMESDAPDIVSVEGDKIIGLAEGKATLTVTSENGKTASVIVNVLPIPLRSMTFRNNEDMSLLVGTKQKLDFVFSPLNITDSEFTWNSSNSQIISVDSEGNIDCKAVGIAVITVTHVASQTTIEKQIEVLPIKVTGISVSGSKSALTIGESVVLAATVSPDNASNKAVQWSSSNTNVATVSNGTVKAVGAGNATITCSSADGPSAAYNITVKGNSVTMKVSFSASCSNYNHVGNDWSKAFLINGKTVSANTTITVSAGETVTFGAQITENDKIPDVGYGSISVTLSASDIQNGFTKTWTVNVKEGSGRYSGYVATWTVTLRVSR